MNTAQNAPNLYDRCPTQECRPYRVSMKMRGAGKHRRQRRVIVAVGFVICLSLLAVIWGRDLLPPKVVTEECPFCNLYACDGLALIDTQTGATDLVDIWLQDHTRIGEAGDWETQLLNGDHSTFSFMAVGGYQQTHMGGALLTFTPEKVHTTAYFCQEHADLAIDSYVLVDRQQRGVYTVYVVQPGENYQIRHYSVEISQDGDEYTVAIESNLFEQEVAQWRAEQETSEQTR